MSGVLGLGNWLGTPGAAGGQQGQTANPLVNYADRMRAAGMGAAMGAPPAQSPLVAAYTPPAYQTTPPHVDINAIIAAMNQQNQAMQGQAPAMPTGLPGLMPAEGANNGVGDGGPGEIGGMSADRGDITSEARGFQTGGYTGDAPVDQDVGDVHGQEFVLNAHATRAIGPELLEMLNRAGPEAVDMLKSALFADQSQPAVVAGTVPKTADIGAANDISQIMRDSMLQRGRRDTGTYTLDPRLALAEKAASVEAQRIDPQGERGGFKRGGYTGDGSTSRPAGNVHGQEFVLDAPATKAVGRKTLDKINEGDPKAVAVAAKTAERVKPKDDSAEIAKEVTRRVASRHDGKDKK